MIFLEREINEILKYYNIGSLVKFKEKLKNGFQSNNIHILTEKGDFVIRVLYDIEKNIKICMKVYEYFAQNGIKTPIPMPTKNSMLFLSYKGHFIVIQTFLEGNSKSNIKEINQLLSFFGNELGKVHYISKRMVKELGKEIFIRDEDTITSVRSMAKRYGINNEYINNQYEEWEKEIENFHGHLLTKAVIHGDIGPKDFFFKNGNFTGITDFNAAGYDYLLFDIAPMMMYCRLFYPKRLKYYKKFVNAYLEKSPVKKEEFKWLHTILKTRWLGQIFYHQYRYEEGITRGLVTGKREENLQGVNDGVHFLKILEKFGHNAYFEVL